MKIRCFSPQAAVCAFQKFDNAFSFRPASCICLTDRDNRLQDIAACTVLRQCCLSPAPRDRLRIWTDPEFTKGAVIIGSHFVTDQPPDNRQRKSSFKMSASSTMECTVSIGSEIQERMEQFLKSRILSGFSRLSVRLQRRHAIDSRQSRLLLRQAACTGICPANPRC